MKKIIIAVMLVVATSAITSECFAQSAMDQLRQTAGDSDSGHYTNGSYDYEGASHNAGHNFDTSSDTSVVDLRDAGDHPTPMLLRNPGD